MGVVSKVIPPYSSPEATAAWDRITLAGVVFTGHIDIEGTPWKKKRDRRSGRGRNGARNVGTGWDLGEWTITLSAFDDETDAQLAALVDAVTGGSAATQDRTAIPVDHPSIAASGVTQVTLKEADTPTLSGSGALFVWKLKVEEHRPPSPVTPRAPQSAPQSAEGPGGRSRFAAEELTYVRGEPTPSADP